MLAHPSRTAMISTLFCLSALLAISSVVTVVAFVRAKDGFEDERGFHAESQAAFDQSLDDRELAPTAPLPTCTGAT